MKEDINIVYYNSPYGELILGDYNDQLCLCDWRYRKMRQSIDRRIQKFFQANYVENYTPVINQTITQLEEYFSSKREKFNIPLIFAGTAFQVKVWDELLQIPFGSTSTYLKLSEKIGNVNAIRAVSSANGANAISILVPCHRIIGTNGKLIGYAGGLSVKKRLLKHENALINPQLDLFDD